MCTHATEAVNALRVSWGCTSVRSKAEQGWAWVGLGRQEPPPRGVDAIGRPPRDRSSRPVIENSHVVHQRRRRDEQARLRPLLRLRAQLWRLMRFMSGSPCVRAATLQREGPCRHMQARMPSLTPRGPGPVCWSSGRSCPGTESPEHCKVLLVHRCAGTPCPAACDSCQEGRSHRAGGLCGVTEGSHHHAL